MKAVVLGATGYTGSLLLRILNLHPHITAIVPVSRSQANAPVREFDPGVPPDIAEKLAQTQGNYAGYDHPALANVDVVFSALPHLASAEHCAPFVGRAPVIDLSADFRHDDNARFHGAYGHDRPAADLQDRAVYGLCEVAGDAIKTAEIVANPGCYPTATLLPLIPLLRDGIIGGDLIVNALSGISGAGRKEKTNLLFCERTENVNAYSPGLSHRHSAEIIEQIERVAGAPHDGGKAEGGFSRLLFTPHLVPIDQGMAVTTVAGLQKGAGESAVRECLEAAYGASPCISLVGRRIPETRHVRGTNRCDIGFHIEGDRVILFSVIDNLWKGASGQAVQNMNLRLGFAETAGLRTIGEV